MKVVLITGASNGIGLHTVEGLAKEGDYLIYATARTPENASELQKLADLYPNNIIVKKLDVTDTEENINRVVNEIGRVDILINNAGIGLVGTAESCGIEQIQRVFETNVLGVIKVTNAVLPAMREANSGMILTISSIVGNMPDSKQPSYSGSKAMIDHHMAVLRNDLKEASYNIVVADINPGPVVTNFATATPDGNRFEGTTNPYPQMQKNIENWRKLMEKGQPVEETVNTIREVIHSENPNFWNATEKRVEENFSRIYHDPTGNTFTMGPIFKVEKPIERPFFMHKDSTNEKETVLGTGRFHQSSIL